MGNSGSAANSENEEEEATKESIEDIEKDYGDIAVLDLTVLFDPKQLRLVADEIKEDSTVSPLQQHHTALIRWLEERRSRGAETVTLMQFIDSFSNKGVSKEVATEIFQQFDTEGAGVVDLDYLQEMLDLSSRSVAGFSGVRSDLQAVISILQDCFLAPGLIDAFTNAKTIQTKHGQRLFKFLSRNRALSSSLPLPALKGFITTTDMRLKVLNAHLSALKEKADSKKQEPPLQADEILKPINRCFTSAEVSSNRNDASKLIDNDNGTYWQSDGPARSHWVRLTIPPNVVIKQLSMYVVSSDQSYMPHHVVVHGGRDESNLTELNDVRIPNHITGDFTLLENLKIPYQVIQIAIKRCHSDGCDTRIRQIKAIGYRVVKSKGVSIMDATAMWYLSVLASTAQASLPVAPHLRESIIQHTKISLSHMNPLSLSTSSSEKPGFLSRNVMEQMEKFLHTIICMDDGPVGEELVVLLEFAFARGSLGSILDVMKLLLERLENQYPAVSLLRSLSETEEKAVRKHGQKLPVVILSCDGGVRDSGTSPANVLLDNWKANNAYFTATGKTKCNMAFGLKSGNMLTVTRIFMKLSRGSYTSKGGMVFVFDSDNIKDESGETLFQPLQEYDDWTDEDYRNMKDRHKNDHNPYDPVAYFTVDKDWVEVDIVVDRLKTGSCVVVKFLGPRNESAEQLGIVGINIIGYEQHEETVLQQKSLDVYQALPDDEDELLPGSTVFMRCLKFLQIMSKDAVNMKAQTMKDVMQEKDTTIDVNDVSMQQLWKVYNLIINQSVMKDEEIGVSSEMVLNLFHIALPYLKPSAQRLRESRKLVSKGKKVNADKFELEVAHYSSQVFQSLCDIVDLKPSSTGVHKIAKSIILDGAEIFFPDAKARRAHLLSLVSKVMEDGKAVSLAYTFESLCRFFSNKDASGLLGLPEYLPQESFQPQSVVHVMKTLVSVAFRECSTHYKEASNSDVPSNIVLLLCAMQKSLLAWCHIQCSNENSRNIAVQILLEYVEMVSEKCIEVLKTIEGTEKMIKAVDNLEYSFVSIAMRQLILFLNLFAKMEISSISLLRHLQPLASVLSKISKLLPELFTNGSGLEKQQKEEDTILREWEMESEHDYENNMHLTKVFNCPGCTSFKVEFSPQCQTERKYDYLQFTDSSGRKRRFDQSAGSEKWPLVVEFDAGQRLHFLFHSDGSTTSWGYKFKVFAIGSPDVAVTWICDLQLILARCFGIFCSYSLDSKKALGKGTAASEENEEERALLHSELWGSLFRGGYMVGKLERSLSGFHRTNPSDSIFNMFLGDIASIHEHPEEKSEKVKTFLTRCKELYKGQKIGGGELLENAVNAVFSALLWHTQELREVAASFAGDNPPKDIPNSIVQAYKAAESTRRILLEHRQKLLIQLDAETNENSKEKIDPDTPLVSCREKALFLLKFAGLSKFTSRKQSTHMFERRSSILNRAPKSFQRQESHEQKKNSHFEEANEKFPSFQLILDFVTNVSLSHVKIHDLLQLRCKYAKTIAKVYSFAADYIDSMAEVDQPKVPALLFLQNMLISQDSFPQHYADYLNGCGLEIENLVRNAFYNFVRKLSEIVGSTMHLDTANTNSPIFKCSQAYLLHFLDVEWKSYDYYFITELDLPYLLINSVKGAPVQSKEAEEQNELKMYERHQQYFKEAQVTGINDWCTLHRDDAPVEKQRDINLFIARYSSDLEVVITCDGCQEKIKGSRFRCLNCVDMDLCSTCYRKGTKPNDHSDQHEVIDLRFTCDNCKAFIVETRIHCNECNDFDLCFGCYKNARFPDRHNSSHSVTKSHLIPGGLLQTKAAREKCAQAYIHHHSWLQFSALALSLSEHLQNRKGIEAEYVKHAVELLLACLYKLVDSLITPTDYSSRYMKTINQVYSRVSKVKFEFEEIEKVVEVSSMDDENVIRKADSASETLYAEDPGQQHGTFALPHSEPHIGDSTENSLPNTEDDEYFSLSTGNAQITDISSQTVLGMPALEDSDPEDEDISQRSDLENLGIDEVDENEVNMNKDKPDESDGKTNGTQKTDDSAVSSISPEPKNEVNNTETIDKVPSVPSTSEVKPETVTIEINSKTETDAKTETETVLKTDSDKTSETDAKLESDTKTESDTVSKSDMKVELDTTDGKLKSKAGESKDDLEKSDESKTTDVDKKTSEEDNKKTGDEVDKKTGDEVDKKTGDEVDKKTGDEVDKKTGDEVDKKTGDEVDKKTGDENDDLFNQEMSSKTFMQEKLLGLIGAIIPTERNVHSFIHSNLFADFITNKLLPALLTIIKTQPEKLRLVALGVLTKTLHCFGPEIADAGIEHSKTLQKEVQEKTDDEKEALLPVAVIQQDDDEDKARKSFTTESTSETNSLGETNKLPGQTTVAYLFNLGAECFQNSDLETASGVDTVLKSLWNNTKWMESLAHQANETLQELSLNPVHPSLLSLFSLMFLAGFPDIYHKGSLAQVKEGGDEVKSVVVLEYSLTNSVSAVNFKNRKKISVKEHAMEPIIIWNDYLDKDRLPLLLDILRKMFLSNKGQIMSLERMWVLGLICKALLNILKMGIDKENMLKVVHSGAVPYIVHLACQGTGFSNQWLLCDLEVLSWRMYKGGKTETPDASTTIDKTPAAENEATSTKTTPSESTAGDNKEGASAAGDLEVGSADAVTVDETAVVGTKEPKSALHGLDNETRLCMETIHDALGCPYPILRAIYEHFGKDRDKLLEEVQRSFDGTGTWYTRTSDEIRELAKSWEKQESTNEEENFLVAADSTTDVGILKFQPQKVEFKDLRAKPEGGENPNKLISSLTEAEINETMLRQRRTKSADLLLKELENKTRENTREFNKKLNHAVAVGYARHLVGWLFASWPSSEGIVSELLDNINQHSIVGLLDLIQSGETKEHFQKVVHNFIRCCTKQLVQPLALSAVQCMGDVRLASETRESEHKYKNNSKVEDKVHIPGATSLFIKFDDRCSTEHNCDELLISSSENFLQNRRVFSGPADWHDFEMPGDTVYYRFTSDSSNNDWGWKFTVTGGQLGRFETGCSILSALLAQDLHFARKLPLKQLWSWLIVVACNQVGQQRLMATGLLLRILQIAAGDPSLFGDEPQTSQEKNRLNLSLLRPLWSLYTSSIESDTGTSLALISPVIRGLSELFLVVENIAQDWGEAEDLVAGLATDKKLKSCFTKIVSNIAAIGLAIGIPNKALEMIQKAKENPPSPTPADENKSSKDASKQGATIELRIRPGDSEDDNSEDEDMDDMEDVRQWLEEEGDTDDDDDDDDDDDTDSDSSDLSET